jgi:imidazolonepropionase-like amidohydrolase
MKKRLSSYLALALMAGFTSLPVTAQGLVITNARIIDGNGNVIPQGSVVVRDGKIVSVSPGTANAQGAKVIDARGMTVMPGFIDAHRHVIQGEPNQWMKDLAVSRMQEFLDGGFTTILSCGDPLPQILDLRGKLAKGEIKGPRLYAAAFLQLARAGGGPMTVDPARVDTSRPPDRPTKAAAAIPREETLAAIQNLSKAGVDAFKSVITITPGGPEKDTLALIASEAKKLGIPSITHAVSVIDTLAAVEAKTDVLVHTPHIGQLTPQEAKTIADAKIPMMSTLGVFVPTFAEDNARIRARTGDDNLPRFRDLDPFPMNTLSSAGQGPVNARMLWDAGITYGYGTDTTFVPRDSLAQELRPLRLVFSNKDIIKSMTVNAAAVIGRSKELGTLEAGKIADIVMLDGNPLDDIESVLKVKLVIKAGDVMVDKR